MTYTNQRQIRAAFWSEFPELARRSRKTQSGRILPQNEQPADIRMAFNDYVDALERSGQISQRLSQRVTL
jgi:hypothetical protein